MTLNECKDLLEGLWVVESEEPAETVEFFDVVVSDLMSDVLVSNHESFILVTSLNSEQVVRTADIVDAAAIVLTNGKKPQSALRTLARTHGIPVIATAFTTFDACRALAGCRE
jgi:predicted transcriptional regulator